MDIEVTPKKWYVVSGATGSTVSKPDGTVIATVPEGGQTAFLATTHTVVTSNAKVEVVESTFNFALALLGMQGGGSSGDEPTEVPSGYLPSLFLTTTTSGQGIYTNHRSINGQTVEFKGRAIIGAAFFGQVNAASEQGGYLDFALDSSGSNFFRATSATRLVQYWNGTTGFFTDYDHVYFYDDTNYILTVDEKVAGTSYSKIRTYADAPLALFGRTFVKQDLTYYIQSSSGTRIFYFKITAADGTAEANYVPAIDAYGMPCMFDKATQQPFYNEGSGSFIVGMTVAQARKLWQLPADATKKTLTISLPQSAFVDVETGEIADADVNAALAYAETKGWVITKQYYTES